MTLVSSDDRLAPRVGPKVFSDVPTQEELRSAKRTSGWIVAVCLFLAGMLAAAVAYHFLSASQWSKTEETLTEERDNAVEALQLKSDEYETLQSSFGPYRSLQSAEGRGALVIGRIQELLQARPTARQDLGALYRRQWEAYDRLLSRPWVSRIEAEVANDVAQLGALPDAIERIPPTRVVVVRTPNEGRQCDPRVQACP